MKSHDDAADARAEEAGRLDAVALLERNAKWAARRGAADPRFFHRLVGQQRPRFFWIGCCDSRVPATEIVDLDPGEMFVHRNVANLASADDPSFAAALQFAVGELRVRHVIVTGHYGCGGIQASLDGNSAGALAKWLRPIRCIIETDHSRHAPDDWTAERLCESNVLAQVNGLAANAVVRQAWSEGRALSLHGWVYAIGDGLLRPLCEPVGSPAAAPGLLGGGTT